MFADKEVPMFPQKKIANGSLSVATQFDPVRILVADNHMLIRDALRPALQGIDDNVSLLECGSLREAIDLADDGVPISLAILALHMPGMKGVDSIRAFRDRFPNIPLAVLSGCHVVHDIVRAFDNGAIGFLSKSTNVESITKAVGLMLSGQRYVPGEVMDEMQRRPSAASTGVVSGDAPYPLHRLTERERQVLALLIEGKPNKAIAIALGVQEVTVKLHIRKLMRKLRVSNRTQAVTYALQAGWGPEI
jgi:two-component system nitrate/nitrite response regulator NarL